MADCYATGAVLGEVGVQLTVNVATLLQPRQNHVPQILPVGAVYPQAHNDLSRQQGGYV
jgi:hypothetical protein